MTATPAGATSYAWSGGSTPSTAANSFVNAGTYTVTVTAANGCTASGSIIITQDAGVITTSIINNTGTTELNCAITTINLTATDTGVGSSYAWSGGNSMTTANNGVTIPGIYTVTATAGNGCTNTSSITITQKHHSTGNGASRTIPERLNSPVP